MKSIFVVLFASVVAAALSATSGTARADAIFVAYGNTPENEAIGEWSTSGTAINASFIPQGANGLALSGGDLFAAGLGSPTVVVYSATSGVVVNASLVGNVSTYAEGIAISGNDVFLTSNGDGSIAKYNATTGAQVQLPLIPQSLDPYGNPAIAASGNDLFVTNYSLGTVGEYDATTGAAINASLVTGLIHPQGIALSGGDLFVASFSVTDDVIGEYNATTGAAINTTLIANLAGPLGGIAISGSDLFVGESDYPGLGCVGEYTTSGATVNASLISGLTGNLLGIAVMQTPEPSAWAMLVIGGGAVARLGHWQAAVANVSSRGRTCLARMMAHADAPTTADPAAGRSEKSQLPLGLARRPKVPHLERGLRRIQIVAPGKDLEGLFDLLGERSLTAIRLPNRPSFSLPPRVARISDWTFWALSGSFRSNQSTNTGRTAQGKRNSV